MRTALATAAALLAAASPAAASETVARSAVTAGPVLAGGSVLWADAPSGRPRVLSGGPGRGPVVLESWPRATTKDTGRTVAALAGSATSAAAVVETCTFRLESDFGFLGCAERAFGGPAGQFSPFGWPLPPRGLRRCPGPQAPVSVAAGDGVIAVAYTRVCQGIAQAAASRSRIVVRRGTAQQAIGSAGATHVRVAGRYLAYLEGVRNPERAVLYDLKRRERVRRIAGSDLTAIDVQRDGTLALVRTGGARSCVSILRRRAEEERRLACAVADPGNVAIAGGRVLVVCGTAVGTRLVLLGRRGGRRLLQRAPRPRAIGGFDLAADRAVWSVGPVSGYQRIELQRL